ncbi:ABC transporter ATP-binding protein [Carnobacterium gallinarum]|uniref:ABC transporter ATP-binding protein n=1 Tax=Carnobacterium gallinarum TaxID=2749 RepID=UPI000558FE93|nr:ATP-binding cassette domain-containing protein [Carnobacterium gallinarum]
MTPLIQLNSLSYKKEEQVILSDISLSIQKQDFITFSGPSGSGKSTLLKIIASLLSPTSGEILIAGQNWREIEPTEYRKKISYCFQQPTLFGSTVQDNLTFPYTIRELAFQEQYCLDLLAQVDLPKSYLTKSVQELSGGERQRVALIRNLVFLPQVLLLDEVTAGLDEESKTIVQRLITLLNQDKKLTILQVTHDAEEIKTATNLKTIQAGKLVTHK